MVEYGVLVTITDDIAMVGDRYYVKATVKCFDTEDGSLLAENSAYAREALNKKGMDEAQVTGSASSYARKYALGGMFNLAVDADPDEIEPEAEKKTECQARFTRATLGKMLDRRGIDAGDFAKLAYNCEFEGLAPNQVDWVCMHFEQAMQAYANLDAKRPRGA